MRWTPHRGLLTLTLGVCLVTPAPGQEQREVSEYELKAAFLINFAKFVDWNSRELKPGSPMTICIVGGDRFGGALDRLAEGESVNGHPLEIRRVSKWDSGCRLLFVSKSERDLFPILRQVGPGALTVGEDPSFLAEGGLLNFVVENGNVRFDVNLRAAEHSSVRLSSRLLAVARRVVR